MHVYKLQIRPPWHDSTEHWRTKSFCNTVIMKFYWSNIFSIFFLKGLSLIIESMSSVKFNNIVTAAFKVISLYIIGVAALYHEGHTNRQLYTSFLSKLLNILYKTSIGSRLSYIVCICWKSKSGNLNPSRRF